MARDARKRKQLYQVTTDQAETPQTDYTSICRPTISQADTTSYNLGAQFAFRSQAHAERLQMGSENIHQAPAPALTAPTEGAKREIPVVCFIVAYPMDCCIFGSSRKHLNASTQKRGESKSSTTRVHHCYSTMTTRASVGFRCPQAGGEQRKRKKEATRLSDYEGWNRTPARSSRG